MKRLPSFFAIVLAVAYSAAAAAETLAEAWQVALDAHQRIAAAEAETEAARFGLESAMAERYPRLDVQGGFTQLDDAPRFAFGDSLTSPKLFSDDNFVMATAQLSVPIYTSGMISRGIEAAQSAADASEWQLEALTQNIKLAVAERYVDVLRARSALDVAESSVISLGSHLEDARNRYELGAVPHNDFLAASVSLADAEQRKLQARNRLEVANAAYNRVLGRSLTARVALDARFAFDSLVPPVTGVEELIELALENRSELDGLASRAGALRARSEVERARARPQVALSGGYSLLENQVLDEERFWTVGVNLEWNLFDSGRARARASALDLEADAVMHERSDLETIIALQVRQAWLDRQEAENRSAVAESAVEQAAENLSVVRDRYNAGAGTNTEVLDAETLRAQSLNNRDAARYDVALATLRLARAVGKL